MEYLLVIDMQDDYIGENRNKPRYPYKAKELIENVNKHIGEYPSKSVIYITNRFFWEFWKKSKKLVAGLCCIKPSI